MASLKFNPNFQVVSGALLRSTGGSDTYATASFNNTIGSVIVGYYTIYLYAKLSNVVENPDGSVDFDFLGADRFRIVQTKIADGTVVQNSTYTLKSEIDGSTLFSERHALASAFDTGIKNLPTDSSDAQHYHIPAGTENGTFPAKFYARFTCVPDDSTMIDDIKLGFKGATNTNPPNYIPFAIRDGGKWKALNSHEGFIQIRENGSWVDRSKENKATSMQPNAGSNRVRDGKNGSWLQAPAMEDS